MTDLIQRIEAAKEPRREFFEKAFALLHPCPGQETIPLHKLSRNPTAKFDLHTPYAVWMGKVNSFQQMLDAQAWTSAAEMLLQPGAEYELRVNGFYSHERPACHAWLEDGSEGRASHPSLALLAAILRAERKDDEL